MLNSIIYLRGYTFAFQLVAEEKLLLKVPTSTLERQSVVTSRLSTNSSAKKTQIVYTDALEANFAKARVAISFGTLFVAHSSRIYSK